MTPSKPLSRCTMISRVVVSCLTFSRTFLLGSVLRSTRLRPLVFVRRERNERATREKDDHPRDTFALPVPFRFLKSTEPQEFRNQPANLRNVCSATTREIEEERRKKNGKKKKQRGPVLIPPRKKNVINCGNLRVRLIYFHGV